MRALHTRQKEAAAVLVAFDLISLQKLTKTLKMKMTTLDVIVFCLSLFITYVQLTNFLTCMYSIQIQDQIGTSNMQKFVILIKIT